MDRLIDEIVTVEVKDVATAAAATAVNTVAIVGVSTKDDTIVEYKLEGTEKSVSADFDGDLLKVAGSFFGENNPGRVVCIPVETDPTASDIASTLNTALSMGQDKYGREVDFYNVVIRLGSSATSTTAKALIDALETWCVANFRLAHVELQDFDVAKAVYTALASKKPTRVAVYFHSADDGSLASAIVADRCANDPARGTWAHKSLRSIKADAISKDDLVDAHDKGINVYCKVAGVDRMFFGTVGCNSKAFTDEVVKKDWLKFRTQEAVFNILGSANNGDGVDYSDAGIGSIASAINSIFTVASDNEHRYVMPDSFEVQVPKYDDIPSDDKEERNLPSVKVPFAIQSSIHTVKTVELQII